MSLGKAENPEILPRLAQAQVSARPGKVYFTSYTVYI